MKNDSKSLCVAELEVAKVKFSKGADLGIEFLNEIDAWSRMEFNSRKQISQLRQHGTLKNHESIKDLKSLVYAFRERIDWN